MANLETSTDANVVNPTEAAAEAPKTNNLSDLAQDLMSSHAHRPGLVQEDLAKATEALHANGALANLSIIGLDGKDLIARDEQGQTLLLDASNPENQQVLSSDLVSQPIGANGRTAELAADGSGKYTVVSGDSCWRVANDILTAQGVEQPTDNQIANYIRELEVSNGRSFAQLQVGDEINIPTKIQGGESSQFAAPETTDPASTDTTNTDVPNTPDPANTDTTNSDVPYTPDPANTDTTNSDVPSSPDNTNSADTTVPALLPEAAKQMELENFGIDNSYALMTQGYSRAVQYNTHKGTYSKPSASLDDISNTLNRDDLTANERLGLGMLQTQFDYLKNSEDGTVHLADLDRGKSQSYQEIDTKYLQAPVEASADANALPSSEPNSEPNLETNTEFDPYAGILPVATDGATTSEVSVPPELAAQLKAEQDQIDSSFEMIGSAYLKASQHESVDGSYSSSSINHDDIVAALGRTDLTDAERQGLQILDQYYYLFKNPDTGVITSQDLVQYRQAWMEEAADGLSHPAEDYTDFTQELPAEMPTSVLSEVPAASTEAPAEELSMSFLAPFFNTGSIYEDGDYMAA